jgi:hypothetical protein
LFVETDGRESVLNLGWKDRLTKDWKWMRLWASPDVEPERLVSVAGKCRLTWESFTKRRTFPYGLTWLQSVIDPMTGEPRITPGAKGLSCATFILAMFLSVGIELVREDEWPVRQDDDRKWLEGLRCVSWSSSEMHEQLKGEIDAGCKRIQPQEVIGACACAALPARFSESTKAGRLALDKLEAYLATPKC